MKWFICDVIPDYHYIKGKQNRINNPQERIVPSKWSDSSVMWYLCIADEKGERFGVFAGVIQYSTKALTKWQLLLAKIKSLIYYVVTDYHLIPRKRNRTSYPQERIFALKFRRVLTHRKCFSWKKQEILSSCNNDSIIYRFINEAELMIIKSTAWFVM